MFKKLMMTLLAVASLLGLDGITGPREAQAMVAPAHRVEAPSALTTVQYQPRRLERHRYYAPRRAYSRPRYYAPRRVYRRPVYVRPYYARPRYCEWRRQRMISPSGRVYVQRVRVCY